jgi:hypothetical protein
LQGGRSDHIEFACVEGKRFGVGLSHSISIPSSPERALPSSTICPVALPE